MASKRDMEVIMQQWGIKSDFLEELENQSNNFKMKHGMLASIPLICRSKDCPYSSICSVNESCRVKGSRCLMEIGTIITRFEEYCVHFGIDISGDVISPKDTVDVSMVRDLIDLEIQILRADRKIATSSDFMTQHIAQIDKRGKAYYEDIVHPAVDLKLRLMNERTKTLNKLNATRKDKADLFKSVDSYSNKAQSIIDKVKEKAIEINLEDIDTINNSLNDMGVE